MNEKIITFLNSGLLEKYLLGVTSSEETEQVETYISRHPEVENAYTTLQFNLEVVAKTNAVEAPKGVLKSILDELDDKPVVPLNPVKKYKKWHQFSIAASIVALIFAGQSFYLHSKNEKLSEENQVVVDEIFDLRSDIDMNNKKLDDIMRQFKQLNNPETYKYIIQGNYRAKNLKTVAYINPKEKTSMIDVVSLPQLPEEQCYQIWAELQGKMVSLGILSETDRQLRAIPYTEDALGLNITIEPKGGNTIASLENSVAEIQLK
ncbi:MAG: RNA polymerase subunit sigma-70 [Flavobacteriaceae bacterium CG_4_10_14_3_um_filter_33_47]|nr:anti-sigma factor [Flavobacteriia bacterium]NCP07203.1 anti-sigma factor [Flavobacteriales bacterium]PIV93107.1 MAG: RNA polymerase subunit sigma-70 [Flavobacteriaceae bacterium CG17_big_fil_post_rev_8_21_14_2_50_33_15]PIY10129.1 MAG: RNA polymerase subunit sigma-70 [Flavobacteriaceae bacterium CG_4_10_14_3_um_filter_33_47]PJB17167.1 MAG: RNA polymerase subunit sigma-70 [Flavobacteriaceae bacterium CG_4_9_14_3_um_filter_33_16]